jgi:threonine/homoserine/homoserine lactone efflux protein
MAFYHIAPTYVSTLTSVAVLHTLAVISPGPDFAIVTRNSVLHSRKVGIATVLGISTGILLHMSYLVLGFGVIVSSLVKVLFLIKIVGCLYLGFLGWKSLRSSTQPRSESSEILSHSVISPYSAFWSGLLTNLLNPKAILFSLSLFTIVIDKSTPPGVLLLCGAMIVLITMVWFLIVSLCFSGIFRGTLLRLGRWIDRLTGGFLLFVASKIGLSCFE